MTVNTKEYEKLTYEAAEIFNRQDYKKALKKFLELEKANSKNIKVHEVLSYIYLQLHDIDKAQKEYNICRHLLSELHPEIEVATPKTFDEIVDDAGNLRDIEKEYKKIMRARKKDEIIDNFEVPAKLAILYMADGNYKKAEDILTKFRDKAIATVEKLKKNKSKRHKKNAA